MKLEQLEFTLEKGISKKTGKAYTFLQIVNLETGEVERILNNDVVKAIKSMLFEV